MWLLRLIGTGWLGLLVASAMDGKAEPLLIAHAGGGFEGQAYTNSIEALNHSYTNGFRLIEVDFSWTADGHLVCLHDWNKTHKKIFGNKPGRPIPLASFEAQIASHEGFQVCTAKTLALWLAGHPDVRIITDIKHRNLDGIRYLMSHHAEVADQLIPQFYQPEEYAALKALGFNELIWILYQYKGSRRSVLEHSQGMQLMAVSMRARQAKNRTLQQLRAHHRLFVYTINNPRELARLSDRYGVSGFYTDFLQ